MQGCKEKATRCKAAGSKQIPLEVINYMIFDDLILHYAHSVLNKSLKSENWCISHLKPIPKSDDLSIAANYRGISLLAIAVKITNKLHTFLRTSLRPNQISF